MAKISEYADSDNLQLDDKIIYTDVSDTTAGLGGTTKGATWADVAALIGGGGGADTDLRNAVGFPGTDGTNPIIYDPVSVSDLDAGWVRFLYAQEEDVVKSVEVTFSSGTPSADSSIRLKSQTPFTGSAVEGSTTLALSAVHPDGSTRTAQLGITCEDSGESSLDFAMGAFTEAGLTFHLEGGDVGDASIATTTLGTAHQDRPDFYSYLTQESYTADYTDLATTLLGLFVSADAGSTQTGLQMKASTNGRSWVEISPSSGSPSAENSGFGVLFVDSDGDLAYRNTSGDVSKVSMVP